MGGTMVPDRIEREIVIDAPAERVWELITEAEHLGRWFGDAGAEIDLRPGGEMILRWAESGASRGRVVAVEPPTRFAYRWAPFEDPGGEEPGEGNSTLVEFTLQPEGDATRLRVVESGFASLATSEEQRAKNLDGNTRGWKHETDELREYAEKVAA
ncbi:MAG TPA: SRPBCC family protein [Solirubrobacteraceae bacterium]|nr:SRPBCC family protein [Solirubrobacteraceae bacterium]